MQVITTGTESMGPTKLPNELLGMGKDAYEAFINGGARHRFQRRHMVQHRASSYVYWFTTKDGNHIYRHPTKKGPGRIRVVKG